MMNRDELGNDLFDVHKAGKREKTILKKPEAVIHSSDTKFAQRAVKSWTFLLQLFESLPTTHRPHWRFMTHKSFLFVSFGRIDEEFLWARQDLKVLIGKPRLIRNSVNFLIILWFSWNALATILWNCFDFECSVKNFIMSHRFILDCLITRQITFLKRQKL